MHDTHLGPHAPPHINQLPMVKEPHDFLHSKDVMGWLWKGWKDDSDFPHKKMMEVGDGKMNEKTCLLVQQEDLLVVAEEGADNLKITTKFQKYFGKNQAYMGLPYKNQYPYMNYNHQVDLKKDEFLNSLGKEEKKEFDEEMKKIWATKKDVRLQKEDAWYMILEGENGKKVALYQDEAVFEQARDAPLPKGWSWKGCRFEDLASAKSYIQMARDEEGDYWQWPKEIPVIWKKGPLTQNDIAILPGWGVCIDTLLIEEEKKQTS